MTGKILLWAYRTKFKIQSMFYDETGEVNIVAIVILIAIAVALALLFKDQIAKVLNNLFQGINGKKDEFSKPLSGTL